MKKRLYLLFLFLFPIAVSSPFPARAGETYTVSGACSGNASAADWDTIFQCVSDAWQRASLWLGASSDTCDATHKGILQWNGTAFTGCDGSTWLTLGGAVLLGTSTAATNPHRDGDVTTGLFSPTANASTVAIATAGVERLRVTATGSVGIGTSVPEAKLDVLGDLLISSNKNSYSAKDFIIRSDEYVNSVETEGWLPMYGSSSVNGNVLIFGGGHASYNSANKIMFYTGGSTLRTGTEQLTILSTGEVGIGTSNPLAKLAVTAPSLGEFDGANGNMRPNLDLIGTATNKTVGVGPSLTFALPANTDGSSTWQQARIMGGTANTTNQSPKGRLYLQTRDYYNRGSGNYWYWRTGLVVDYTGYVGIGTVAPSTTLEVYGASQTTAALTDAGVTTGMLALNSSGTAAGNGGTLTFGNSQSVTAGSVGFAAIKGLLTNGGTNTTGDLAFSTRNGTADTALTERMRILGGGNVGIGTTGPASKLEVHETTPDTVSELIVSDTSNRAVNIISPRANNLVGSIIISGSASDLSLGVRDYPDAIHILGSNGKVGIGIAAPTTTLDVRAGVANTWVTSTVGTNYAYTDWNNTGGYMRVGRERSTGGGLLSGSSAYAGIVGSNGAYPLHFGTNGTVRMTIDSAGSVGIGTTGPLAKLDVQQGADTTALNAFVSKNTGGSSTAFGFTDDRGYAGVNSGATFSLRAWATGDDGGALVNIESFNGGVLPRFYIDRQTGNVGIGTAALPAKFTVNGRASFLGATGNGDNVDTIELDSGSGTVSLRSGIAFRGTFYNYAADTTSRRVADIWAGFSTGTWGTEYLAFGVGSSGDASNLAAEKMRINASGDVTISGTVTIAEPTANSHAATKYYVDTAVAAAGSGTRTSQTFTGNGTWTKPAGVTKVSILAVGGGGSGSAGVSGFAGGGGGGGSIVWAPDYPVSGNLSVTIGGGGAGTWGIGNAGGTTTVGPISAPGGRAPITNNAGGTSGSGGNGGAGGWSYSGAVGLPENGGTATGMFATGRAGSAYRSSTYNAGGGGGASFSGDAGNGSVVSHNATGYGGGGGGGSSSDTGGAGAPGIAILFWDQ